MVVFGGREEAEYVGAFRVLQDSYSSKFVQVDLAVDFVFFLVFVRGKTVTTEDEPTAFPVLGNLSADQIKKGGEPTVLPLSCGSFCLTSHF